MDSNFLRSLRRKWTGDSETQPLDDQEVNPIDPNHNPGGSWAQDAQDMIDDSSTGLSDTADTTTPSSTDYSDFLKDSPSLEKYRQHVENMPQESDYEASTGRKLLTGLVGALGGQGDAAKGMKIQQELENAPYQRAMQRYAQEGAGLKDLVGEESRIGSMRAKQLYDVGRLQQGEKGLEIKSQAEQRRGVKSEADIQYHKDMVDIQRQAAQDRKDYQNGLISAKQLQAKETERSHRAREATARRNANSYEKMVGSRENRPVSVAEQARAQAFALNKVAGEMPEAFDMTDPQHPKIKSDITPQQARAIRKRVERLTSELLNFKKDSPPLSPPSSYVMDEVESHDNPVEEEEE